MTDTTIWYLEMNAADDLQGKSDPDLQQRMVVEECRVKQFRVNQFLYQLVGEHWQWHDKLDWTAEQWQHYAERDDLRLWMARVEGSIAGYFELKKQADNVTELAYFGLSPAFVGKGFGGYLLTEAVSQAWMWAPTDRVIVNTCSLDHPSALSNYQSRGFLIYREEHVSS